MLPEKQALLINKLEPLSYQFKSSITQRLPLHASKPTPKIYNATAVHYSHIEIHIKKNISHTPSTSTAKYTLPQRLVQDSKHILQTDV